MATFKPTLFAVTLVILAAVSSAAPNNQKPTELSLKIPDECIGKGFCNIKPEGYDDMQDLIDSLLTPTFIAQNLGDRIGDTHEGFSNDNDWDNCPTLTTIYESSYLYSSSANESDADYIIQHTLLRQPIVMTNCAYEKIEVNSTEQCFKGLSLSLLNKKTTCQSSSTTRSLFVLDYKTKKIGTKSYAIPCCCHCMVENKDQDYILDENNE